jgi:anti-sigma factor RsiW
MNRDELRTRMADYLDDLLEDDERAAVEAEIARHPALFAEVARVRAVLYRPYSVPAPSADQRSRILARWHDRPWKRVLRYAAVFAAGVVTTFALRATEPPRPSRAPETPPRVESAPPADAPVELPRRIR